MGFWKTVLVSTHGLFLVRASRVVSNDVADPGAISKPKLKPEQQQHAPWTRADQGLRWKKVLKLASEWSSEQSGIPRKLE